MQRRNEATQRASSRGRQSRFCGVVMLWLHRLLLIAGALQFPSLSKRAATDARRRSLAALSVRILSAPTGIAAPAGVSWIDVISATVAGHTCARPAQCAASLPALAVPMPASQLLSEAVTRRAARDRIRRARRVGALTTQTNRRSEFLTLHKLVRPRTGVRCRRALIARCRARSSE